MVTVRVRWTEYVECEQVVDVACESVPDDWWRDVTFQAAVEAAVAALPPPIFTAGLCKVKPRHFTEVTALPARVSETVSGR